jgi:hypothetical protein
MNPDGVQIPFLGLLRNILDKKLLEDIFQRYPRENEELSISINSF